MSGAKSKGFSNPALKAMGIPNLKLPSRNWMIFWSVLTVAVSGVAYDKYEQKQIITKYSDLVKSRAQVKMDTNRLPRKITVFIAPPPNDYLETSLKVWRRYIKPVLYYAGLDYEIIEEDKQGLIRTHVANQIREIRKQYLITQEDDTLEKTSKVERIESRNPTEDGSITGPNLVEAGKEFKRNFDYRDLIGIFYRRPKIEKISYTDSEPIDPRLSGGVICVGRGAYKEYINGLHEGMLGPLEQPEQPKPEPESETLSKQTEDIKINKTNIETENEVSEITSSNNPATNEEQSSTIPEEEIKQPELDDNKPLPSEEDKEPKLKDTRVLPRFLTPDKYSESGIAEEIISQLPILKDRNTAIPSLLHQPVLMIPVPNLSGFTTVPQRIVRFYQKRYYTEQVCSQVSHLINQDRNRPFKNPADLLIGVEEEDDWPNHWVKQGLKKNSEWVQPLKSDKRVTEFMTVLGQDYDEDNHKKE